MCGIYELYEFSWFGMEHEWPATYGNLLCFFVLLGMNGCFFLGFSTVWLALSLTACAVIVLVITGVVWLYFTDESMAATGFGMIIGTVVIGIGVGIASSEYYNLQDYKNNVVYNVSASDKPIYSSRILLFRNATTLAHPLYGQYTQDDPDGGGQTFCVVPLVSTPSAIYNYTIVNQTVQYYAMCRNSCTRNSSCTDKWLQDIGKGRVITGASARTARYAARRAAEKYGFDSEVEPIIILWDDPANFFDNAFKNSMLAIGLSNGLWVALSLPAFISKIYALDKSGRNDHYHALL